MVIEPLDLFVGLATDRRKNFLDEEARVAARLEESKIGVFGESRIRDILMKKIILILLTGDEM
jgi:hypothetical protein